MVVLVEMSEVEVIDLEKIYRWVKIDSYASDLYHSAYNVHLPAYVKKHMQKFVEDHPEATADEVETVRLRVQTKVRRIFEPQFREHFDNIRTGKPSEPSAFVKLVMQM